MPFPVCESLESHDTSTASRCRLKTRITFCDGNETQNVNFSSSDSPRRLEIADRLMMMGPRPALGAWSGFSQP